MSMSIRSSSTFAFAVLRPDVPGIRRYVSEITKRVSAVLSVADDDILTDGRGTRRASLARHITMYLMHTLLSASYSAVGEALSRDRTTVMYAVRRVEAMREDPRFEQMLVLLEWSLRDVQAAVRGGR
jgi:chromosomal replication initiation ATPase DnaA